MNRKLFSMALLAGMTLFAACSDDETNNNGDNGIADGTTLSGTITEDVTLKAGNTYKLSGAYTVEEGATLNIEQGVKIVSVYDDNVDYILIKQGGKINAKGTANAPIVMTSEKEEAGAWGGIHICGRAHTNAEGGKGSSEIGGAEYGGNDDKDNSGTLQYVRLEYTGYDDGFEFFGGSVNVSNMVVISCSDDSFDWTEGWNGTATDLVAYQEAEATLGYDCDCLIEADNNENNYSAAPIAHPTLKNLILVGNGGSKQGVRLRRGTQVTMDNAQICGKGKALTVESTETETALTDGTSSISNTTIANNVDSEKGIYTNDVFAAGEGNEVDANLSYASLDEIKAACEWMAGSWVK